MLRGWLFSLRLFIYCVFVHASHGALIEVSERLVEIVSLLLCGFLGFNSGPWVCQQAPLPAALKHLSPASVVLLRS